MNGLFCVAVHALIYLDKRGCMLSSEELAANICTNPARVRKVMAKLKKAGLVSTRAGSDGGYQLTADPASLTLDAVRMRWRCGWWSPPGTAAARRTVTAWWPREWLR